MVKTAKIKVIFHLTVSIILIYFLETLSPFCLLLSRSSHRRCFVRRGVLRNFAKFTGKHLSESLFFNKVADLKPKACNFIEKETLAQVLSCEFCKISINSFFTEHVREETASILFRY